QPHTTLLQGWGKALKDVARGLGLCACATYRKCDRKRAVSSIALRDGRWGRLTQGSPQSGAVEAFRIQDLKAASKVFSCGRHVLLGKRKPSNEDSLTRHAVLEQAHTRECGGGQIVYPTLLGVVGNPHAVYVTVCYDAKDVAASRVIGGQRYRVKRREQR